MIMGMSSLLRSFSDSTHRLLDVHFEVSFLLGSHDVGVCGVHNVKIVLDFGGWLLLFV